MSIYVSFAASMIQGPWPAIAFMLLLAKFGGHVVTMFLTLWIDWSRGFVNFMLVVFTCI